MPRKSRNATNRGIYTYNEKQVAAGGSSTKRFGSDSQLPFGHCSLSLNPALEPVVTPSGHLYDRVAILEYLLSKTKELKNIERLYEEQQAREQEKECNLRERNEMTKIAKFAEAQHSATTQLAIDTSSSSSSGVTGSGSSSGTRTGGGTEHVDSGTLAELAKRKRKLDERSKEEKMEELRKMSPWVPQFTPHASAAPIKEPPKRPSSPFSGQPLRTKDLIPLNLVRECTEGASAGTVRYICPVSRKTITNQKVVVIKSCGTLMLESAAKEFAYPTMVCPITGKKFKKEDVMDVVAAASGFSASGSVQAKKHDLRLN